MKKGLTLIELILVVAVLIILAVMVISNFNSVGMFNKARDAQRKKDLKRIAVAFEEYYNDKGCYPKSTVVDQLMSKDNCNTAVFSPWLSLWPCDPNKTPYKIAVELPGFDTPCGSTWYKIFVNLENKKDVSIPNGWYSSPQLYDVANGLTTNSVNFGISSSNISWYDKWIDPTCIRGGSGCYWKVGTDPWNTTYGCVTTEFFACAKGAAQFSCQVPCCGSGCN